MGRGKVRKYFPVEEIAHQDFTGEPTQENMSYAKVSSGYVAAQSYFSNW